MKTNKMRWNILAPVTFVVLVLAACVLPPLSKQKARALRIWGVNHVASASMQVPGNGSMPDFSTKR